MTKNVKGLGTILEEIGEAYEEMSGAQQNIARSKEGAHSLLQEIIKHHGIDFVNEALKDTLHTPSRSVSIKAMYDELCRNNPKKKRSEIRTEVASYFNITDKAVQKHIYKGRKK